MVEAIITEIVIRAYVLQGKLVESIYIGGGTPSLLTPNELEKLFAAVYREFSVKDSAEITLEANPDDLTITKIKQLGESRINRLSIGIQSFLDQDLQLMNRAHSSFEAKTCMEQVVKYFDNISVDLIYGMPGSTLASWSQVLGMALNYNPAHLSCYALTIEPKTALSYQVQKGLVELVPEQMVVDQFYQLIDEASLAGYQHYEISNFSKKGREAIHNSNYWNDVPYLGVGPSAHSYDGKYRWWNVANNLKYMKSMANGLWSGESELLSEHQKYNEYVMVRLRTSSGCLFDDIASFGISYLTHFHEQARKHLALGHLSETANAYLLSRDGKAYADRIASDLFLVD